MPRSRAVWPRFPPVRRQPVEDVLPLEAGARLAQRQRPTLVRRRCPASGGRPSRPPGPPTSFGDQDHQPLHQVAQLAHVARARAAGARKSRARGASRLGVDAVLDAGQPQEVLGQLRDVLAPRAQAAARRSSSTLIRWYRSSRNAPRAISLGQVLAGGGDDPHVHRPRSSTLPTGVTSPSWSTRSSLAWVIRLMSPISSRNSVPPWAALEACPCGRRTAPGEGALHVAEHLALDQLRGDRRAVQLDEGLARGAARARGWRARSAPCRFRSRPR